MNEKTTTTRPRLGAPFREEGGEECKPPTFALATEIDRAIDLSCRACDACGAMAMGAGLGFPVGDSATLRFPPPTSDLGIPCTRIVAAGSVDFVMVLLSLFDALWHVALPVS